MSNAAPGDDYSAVAKFLHWVIAALVLAAIPIAVAMVRVGEGPLQNALFTLHKSLGATILILMLLRLVYRLVYSPPPMVKAIPPLMKFGAQLSHFSLYALLIVQAGLGWLGNSAYTGGGTTVFGLFELPVLVGKNEKLAEQVFGIHIILGFAIAVLIVIHVAAAMYHHFVRQDRTLVRMLP